MRIGELLALQIDGTRDWTNKLIADLSGDDWFFQPQPGLAHPLWICGHLATAQHLLIHMRCLDAPVLSDAFVSHFPIGGPIKSRAEHDYPSSDEVLTVMADVHKRTLEAVRGMSDELLAEPAYGKDGAPHPHYTDKRGAVGHADRHEAFHAGQLALLRRLIGKAFLR